MLHGVHGVGKSSVARNTLHFINERKYITGGIIWVQLKGVRDVYSVSKHLQKYIYRSLNLTKREINELTRETCSEEKLLEFIKEFFNNPHHPKYTQKLKKHLGPRGKQQKRFLICFDNAEEIITAKEYDFQTLLKNLTEECPGLKIVITSNKGLNQMSNQVHPVVEYCQQFSRAQSVDLFIDTLEKNGRHVSADEVFDLLLQDKHYPIKKLMPKHKTNRILKGQVEELRGSMVADVLYNDRRIKEALEHHNLFRELCGNPTSIVILASALANPMVTKSPTLAQLYKTAITDRQELFDDGNSARSQDSNSEKGYAPLKLSSNNFSL